MEDYSYWNSQSPSAYPAPMGMPYNKNGEMPMMRSGMNQMAGYPDFELPPTFDASIPRSVDPNLQSPPGVYQMVNLNSTFPPNTAISPPVTPTASDSDSQENQSSISYPMDATNQKHKFQSVKRRMQNREAQRRFRERKEERQQTLEQRAAELEAKCQELSEGFRQKSEEVTRILQEKEALTGEIQDLRKRWRLMVMLLQRPNGLQSLSSLLASDSSLPSTPSPAPSGGSSSPSPASPATEAAPLDAPLDELLGCLHALLVPTETPHSSSSSSSS
ncbi:hypothetical protein BJX68DRAFT_115501 [Aspergillus pseudodeflectus]|uniref:BZIP domain-containing protein n=1 Tax=Aspergillus pseudodeflectus TaxID=176178 RepID=A0ABR4L4C6_9EURO